MADGRGQLGWEGEELACRELARRGCEILDRRVRTRAGEIDIVAREGGTIVFVEVKTRTSETCGSAGEALTWQKRRRLCALAVEYLQRGRLAGAACRFDVVTVLWPAGASPRVEVIRSAFECGGGR